MSLRIGKESRRENQSALGDLAERQQNRWTLETKGLDTYAEVRTYTERLSPAERVPEMVAMSLGSYDYGQQRHAEMSIFAGKPADEPRSPTLTLSYPHMRPSLEPKRLLPEQIWAVAKRARRQLFPRPMPKMDFPQIAGRKPLVEVDGLVFRFSWKLGQPDSGRLAVSK